MREPTDAHTVSERNKTQAEEVSGVEGMLSFLPAFEQGRVQLPQVPASTSPQ